jgi:phosphatidylglycerol:prolipoprotein diacylglycerol transferase
MLVHPQFDPVAIHLGPLAVHWYGLMYLVGFLGFLWLGNRRTRNHAFMTPKLVDDFLMYGVLGVVIGGRLGQVFFYEPEFFLSHPIEIFKVWNGGMSFHGGFIGVLIAMYLFAHRINRTFFELADFVAPLVPLGLAAGRLGNFINGELWGRVTSPDLPWAMRFPQAIQDDIAWSRTHPDAIALLARFGGLPRHPSQLYEVGLEGIALFMMLWLFSSKPRPRGQVSALFLIGYGAFRFISEYFRTPDSGIFGLSYSVSMGQWLSLPMVVAGLILWGWSHRNHQPA